MFALKYELEIFFATVILTAVLFTIFHNNHNKQVSLAAPIPKFVTQVVTPTPIPSKKTTQILSWSSSDGKTQVIMKTQYNDNLTKTYYFFVLNLPLFYETVNSTTSFSIPFNAFSPNNKYLFLQKNTPEAVDYFVFFSSGQPFTNNARYLDVRSLFKNYTSNYILHQVTGWASDTLLIIETTDRQGHPGTSFWFDVTAKSFTPLATRF